MIGETFFLREALHGIAAENFPQERNFPKMARPSGAPGEWLACG